MITADDHFADTVFVCGKKMSVLSVSALYQRIPFLSMSIRDSGSECIKLLYLTTKSK